MFHFSMPSPTPTESQLRIWLEEYFEPKDAEKETLRWIGDLFVVAYSRRDISLEKSRAHAGRYVWRFKEASAVYMFLGYAKNHTAAAVILPPFKVYRSLFYERILCLFLF